MARISTWMPVVAVALRDHQDRWLLHRRPEGKQHAGLWEFPGGKVEFDEIPTLALVREAREELGIDLSPDDLRPLAFADEGGGGEASGIVILLYSADRWQGDPRALEGGEVGWFTVAELEALPKPPLDRELARFLHRHALR